MLRILGEQITAINAERKEIKRGIKITNNLATDKIYKKTFFVAGKEQPGLVLDFTYTADYGKTAGKIELNGSVFFTGENKELSDIEASWKKKKVDENIMVPLLNRAWEVSSLQAVAIADKLRLPMPIRLPRLVPNKK